MSITARHYFPIPSLFNPVCILKLHSFQITFNITLPTADKLFPMFYMHE